MTELIMVRVTPSEKEFYKMLSSILSELDVDGKDNRVIKNNSLSDFVRMSLSLVSNSDLYNIFQDSRVKSRLKSNKAKNEFVAFRQNSCIFLLNSHLIFQKIFKNKF